MEPNSELVVKVRTAKYLGLIISGCPKPFGGVSYTIVGGIDGGIAFQWTLDSPEGIEVVSRAIRELSVEKIGSPRFQGCLVEALHYEEWSEQNKEHHDNIPFN